MLFCAVKEHGMLKNRFLLYIAFIALSLTGCAKRGNITGGPKDTIAPVLVRSYPENMTTNFKGSEIRIDFSEYIKIKDVNRQLIISPPMETQPVITPMAGASKFIKRQIKDTLQPETTYSFNFGQSITDNNEGNPYSQFKFVFSTGAYIDSLELRGTIKDAYSRKTDDFVTVMLYEAETFTDSTIYTEKPRYVTNTLDSMVNYRLENLKEGKYYLIALKDKSSNYVFNPASDKIAFFENPITVPNDTLYELNLFMQQGEYKALKPVQASSNRYYAPYEGNSKGTVIDVKNAATNETINSVTTKVPEKDSLQVWVPREINTIADSLLVSIRKNDSIKEFTVKTKEMKATDSLTVEPVQKGTLNFRDTFTIKTSTPIRTIDTTKMALMDKDSVAVAFTTKYDAYLQELKFDFEKKEEQKYRFTLMPGAIKDFYEKENDTLNFTLTTRTYTDYGNLRVILNNADRFPLILEVLDTNEKVVASYYSEGETEIDFNNLQPNKFNLRVIYDDNKNGEWDSGSYPEKRQPEEVIYHPDTTDVRSNWDVPVTFNLGG